MLQDTINMLKSKIYEEYGVIINVKEIRKFSEVITNKIFKPVTHNITDDKVVYPIFYALIIGRKKYLSESERKIYKMKFEEKIGREFFIIKLQQNTDSLDINSLTFKILLSIYRSLHKQIFDKNLNEFIKLKQQDEFINIPLKTIGIYWNPNLIDARDMLLSTHKYTTDTIHNLLTNDKINDNPNIVEKIYTFAHTSKSYYTKKYLPDIFLIDIDIEQTIPFSFSIKEIFKQVVNKIDEKHNYNLNESLLYILNTGGGYHILLKSDKDKNKRKLLGKLLNTDIVNILNDILKTEYGITEFDIEIKYSKFLSPIPGTKKNEQDVFIELY